MRQVAVGDRVEVSTFLYKGEGTVSYIDWPNLYNHIYSPIQVEMDNPDDDGHSVKRFTVKEIKPL